MMTLEAGDVVLTGTSAGVGPLSPARRPRSKCQKWARLRSETVEDLMTTSIRPGVVIFTSDKERLARFYEP